MKIPREIESQENQRATRWDVIKRRHCTHATPIKSDVVKRLIEMDFIGAKQRQRLIQNETDMPAPLDPVLVMDLRHKMCKQNGRSLPLATVQLKSKDAWCKEHNQLVEERHITNDLNKLRQQLQKQRQRISLDIQSAPHAIKEFNNKRLVESLEKTAEHIEDFYTAPLEAYDDMEVIFNKSKAKIAMHGLSELINEQNSKCLGKEETINEIEEDETISEEILKCIAEIENCDINIGKVQPAKKEEVEVVKCQGVRCVRFVQDVGMKKYELHRDNSFTSSTSDGLDSVISDLAEEALQELREEEALQVRTQTSQDEPKEDEIEECIEEVSDEDADKTLIPEQEKNELATDTGHIGPLELIVRRLELPESKKAANMRDLDSIPTESDDDRSSISNHEQNKIIEQLFQARAHTNAVLIRKYFVKWTHYTTMEKIERENFNCKTTRIQQINAFLDKLRKEKTRINKQPKAIGNEMNENADAEKTHKSPAPQLTKKYQTKIKMQQDIIDLQRMKLERQERIIMELKLFKLSEEARDAREELKQELKTVIQSGDPKAKAKAKCLQLIGNLRDKQDIEEEELSRLQGKALFVPQFLQNMQERALDRSIRHEQARQRRLQAEAEREALKIAAEEARRQEDEEAKQRRIDVLREKRRQEKLGKIVREQQRQRAIDNHRKSLQFCRYMILKRVGMEGFKRLLELKRHNQRKSEVMRRHMYKRNCLRAWRSYCAQQQAAKLLRAKLLHEKLIKRRVWQAWKAYIIHERSNYLVAVDWYELHITETIFKEWFYHVKRNQLNEVTKMRQAISHHEWHTKWKVLDSWQRLPQMLQLERETEERRQRWRMKIWELLPDYQPNREV